MSSYSQSAVCLLVQHYSCDKWFSQVRGTPPLLHNPAPQENEAQAQANKDLDKRTARDVMTEIEIMWLVSSRRSVLSISLFSYIYNSEVVSFLSRLFFFLLSFQISLSLCSVYCNPHIRQQSVAHATRNTRTTQSITYFRRSHSVKRRIIWLFTRSK